jgi:hypothetical protein
MDAALSVAEHNLKGGSDREVEVKNYAQQEPSSERFVVHTIVEATTVLLPAEGEADSPESMAFERVLDELRQWEMAYFLTTGDVSNTRISRSSIYPLIPYATFSPFEKRWSQLTIMQVNMGGSYFPKSTEVMEASQIETMTATWQSIRRSDPLMEYEKALYAADRLLDVHGDYSVSVVQMHTAGEILLDSLLLSLAWEEISFGDTDALTREEIPMWFGIGSSLEKRLRTQYHTRLKGWRINSSGTPLHQWSEVISTVRNRIVHFGYDVSVFEAHRCRTLVDELETFLSDLLASDDNRNRYPRTAIIFVGRDGLRERGKLVGRVKQLSRDSSAVKWAEELRDFRSWVGKLVHSSTEKSN